MRADFRGQRPNALARKIAQDFLGLAAASFLLRPPMNGITLALMSMEATPGYPAPEIACMVVAITRVMPNCFSGASAMRQHDGGTIRIGGDLPLPAAHALLVAE